MPNRNIVIRTEHLAAGYGTRLLFRDLNLEIGEGEFALIRGENGAGKTTLIKILLGLQAPAAGRVFVFGCRTGTREWRSARRQAAYVNQHATASDFPISAREVVAIGTAVLPRHRAVKREAALEAMRLADCLHLADSPFAVLSGGEKQRVSLARCLAQQARLLLLDEPASHLDRRSKSELLAILKSLNRERGITVVLVSHEHHDAFAEEEGVTLVTFERTAARAAANGAVSENEITIGGRA